MRTFFWLPTWTLYQREVVRFLRQRNRVIGAVATPILFWLLIGAGMGQSFRPNWAPEGFSYLEYFFPGTVLLMILFTSIFSTISIIEDRREGFLQAVLAAPVQRGAIVLGKMLGGATLATMQGLLLCALAPFSGISLSLGALFQAGAIMFLTGCALTGLGYLLAWPMQSVQGFHAMMNLILMPMWLLSGALFPASGAAPWLGAVMTMNPLHYGLIALQHTLYPPSHPLVSGQWGLLACVLLITAIAILAWFMGTWLTKAQPGRNP